MLRLSHILTTAALVAVCAAPASAATFEQIQGSDRNDGASTTGQSQDLRSPDAVDAAQHRGLYAQDRGPYVLNRDYGSPDALDAAPKPAGSDEFVLNRNYGSPDAADAARDLPPVQTAVLEPRDAASGGFDWGDAGIGAAGMLAIFSIAGGSALLLTGRRRRHGLA